MQINSAKDLNVYKAAETLATEIFQISKTFPAEEKYALTSQIQALIPFSVSELARSVGEKALRSTFHKRVDRLRWREQ